MGATARVLIDHYRCPETFLNLAIKNHLVEQRGFFRFGADITCYGTCSGGYSKSRMESVLYDVARDVVLNNSDSQVYLPFDPTEIVDNLRLERYVGARGSGIRERARKIYYFLRPIFPFSVRKQIQKFQLRNWTELSFPRWPVDRT